MSAWQNLAPADGGILTDDPRPAVLAELDDDGLGELDDLASYRRARRRARTRRLATGAGGLLALAVIWQVAAMLAGSVFLPSVTQTIQTFAHYIDRPYPSPGSPLWLDAAVSLRRILAGFAIGTAAGLILGAGMSASRVVRHLVDPVIEVLRPLPPLAFIPLFIIWFGIGELPKEVLIVIGVTPIMAVATVTALDQVPDDLRLCARTLGATPLFALLHVQVRSALPGIVTGMRISMAGAWTSIVAVELIAATNGVGYLVMQAGDYLNVALVFSGIITIAIMGLTLDACLRGLLYAADPSKRGLAAGLGGLPARAEPAAAAVRPERGFEKPNTKPSALSISTTPASGPNSADSKRASSRPPKPAPRITIRIPAAYGRISRRPGG
jgi:ABC-type nitrate/sulfonate/bicarbonate transport system permease component